MAAYGVGILKDVKMGLDIVEYLERIDATLAPFGGFFIVHGGEGVPLEGKIPGTLIVIEFPDRRHAQAWYDSPAYRDIIALRTNNSVGTVFLVDRNHKATDVLVG